MHRSAKTIVLLFVCIFLILNLGRTASAKDEKITITLDEGFNGKIKSGKGFPLSIKIENNGESFSGDLLVNFLPSWNTGGAIAINVELPANSTKTYDLSLPGLSNDNPYTYQNEPMIHLYKGDLKNKKKVDFKGENKIRPKYLEQNDAVIGVLSENYDRLKELRILPFTASQMIDLKKEQIPKQALGLEMLDYLIVDEYAVSQLHIEQQEAIRGWIEKGGVLIAGASPNGSQSYGKLYSLLPMKLENETAAPTDFFRVDNGEEPTFKQLPFFIGMVEESATILEMAEGIPASIKKQYGNGTILQTSFSLGDEPLASWKGYSTWFAAFLKHAKLTTMQSGKIGYDFYGSLYWEFVEANEFFPASHFSIGQLIGMLIGYIIIIVPVLYLVLRKFDKREHAWWVVPSIAVMMAAVVFGIGAKDRIGKPQLNQMGVYKVADNQLTGIQATTLLSNKSGEYTLSYPKATYNAVATSGYNGGATSFDPLRGAIFAEKREKMNVVFPNVGYWSSKTIYGQASKKVEGGFIADINLKDGLITGRIVNSFNYDFQEVFIWSGNEKIKLGPLKKGEELIVNKQTKQSFLTKPIASSYRNYNHTDIEKMKIERLEYAGANYVISQNSTITDPIIAGITKAPIIDVSITGKKAKQENLNLILEPFKVENEFSGAFTIRHEMLSTKLNVLSGRIHDNQNMEMRREVWVDNGEYEYILQLPKQLIEKPIKIEEISIVFHNDFVKYTLLNKETGEELPLILNQNQRTYKLSNKENANQYVSKGGEIVLKLLKEANGDQYVQLPSITIKGEVTP